MYYAPLSAIKGFIETCFNCEGDYAKKKIDFLLIQFPKSLLWV